MSCKGECNHFGICPIGLHDCEIVYLNVGKSHFNVCKKHKVRWHIGWNLFSSWLDETEEQWEHNRKVLEGMKEVEPARCEYDEARDLGELVAHTHNKQADTGCTGTTEWRRIESALDRLGEMISGSDDPDGVYAAYADGYDETIDFSLNAEWQHTAPPADDDAFPF